MILQGVGGSLESLVVWPMLFERIKATQAEDTYSMKIRQEIEVGTQV